MADLKQVLRELIARRKADKARIPKVEHRPKCRNCGRTLKLHTRSIHGVQWGDQQGDWVVMRVRPSIADTYIIVTYWDGRFGSYGDNEFCGLRCGYQWAKWHLKENKGRAS